MNHTERPCAAAGLTSYRYGTIMIGATSTQDALNEAGRSGSGGQHRRVMGRIHPPGLETPHNTGIVHYFRQRRNGVLTG